MYKRILVATDGTTLSRQAVKSGIALAEATGAELVAVHVVSRYPVAYLEGGVTINLQDVARIEKEWAEKGRAIVEAVVKDANARNVNARGAVVKSNMVAEAVISAARKHKCDLIVMASHGRKGLKRLLMGSETMNVLTHSTIPVLVLR